MYAVSTDFSRIIPAIKHSRGLHLRETGNNARAKVLLETAEAKQREAMAKMKQSEDEERMVSNGLSERSKKCL